MAALQTMVLMLVGLFGAFVLAIRSLILLVKKPGKFLSFNVRQNPPPCLADNDVWAHDAIKLKDVKIHYVVGGDPNKPLMLFLHGFPEIWFSWRHQLREFAKDYRVVAVDMRGFGDSDKPSGIENYALTHLVEDVKGVIEGLGFKSCILVTHDWGGAVGWHFSSQYPDLVDKLITMNCPHSRSFMDNMSLKQFLSSWYMAFFQLPYMPEWHCRRGDMILFDLSFNKAPYGRPGMVSSEELEAYKYHYSQPGAFTTAINYYRANVGGGVKPADRITMPTLIIWGTRDHFLTERTCDGSAKYVDDCTIKKLDATHWVMQDKPDEVNKYMREFLGRGQ